MYKYSSQVRLLLVIALVQCSLATYAVGAELPQGRWVGWIKMDGQPDKLAATLDTYIYQPESLTEFPRLNMFIKIGLGGHRSSEYATLDYEDVHYDFDSGSITLDTAENDLVIAATVQSAGSQAVLRGQVFSRASAASGTIALRFLSDEPDDGDPLPGGDPLLDTAPYKTELSGQYEGRCGVKDAVVQIETARGLGAEAADPLEPGLTGYSLSARIGFDDAVSCSTNGQPSPGVRNWCTQQAFKSGEFNFFNDTILLTGSRGSTSCTRSGKTLQCKLLSPSGTSDCILNRVGSAAIGQPQYSFRRFNLRASSDQLLPLPNPSPPMSTDLVQALGGAFSGYLHQELTDTYQPVRLNILATVSTENPHNPNMVFLSGATTYYFGSPAAQPATIWSQRFNRKAFYLRPGFALDDPNSDSFLIIDTWNKGYVTGVVYSRSLGRVGTVQLLKGTTFPAAPASVRQIPNPLGNFTGPHAPGFGNHQFWEFRLVSETQSTRTGKSTFHFKGEMLNTTGILAGQPIPVGAFDYFTGAIAFALEDDDETLGRIFSGTMESDNLMQLFWPGAPRYGIRISPSHSGGVYNRLP